MVSYDPETGVLTWRNYPHATRREGDPLRVRDNGNGYKTVTILRKHVYVHRIALAITTGRWPVEVDHVNGDKADNRLCNLREVTHSQNEMNVPRRRDNTSGFKGVGWHKCKGQWRAYIQRDGRQISLGYHPTREAAHRAYRAASLLFFGEYGRAA